jgi:hypothetical protein
MAIHRLTPGQLILSRQFIGDRITCARIAHVVAHDDAGLRIWIATGNPVMAWTATDGRGIRDMPFVEWVSAPRPMTPTRWRGTGVLMFLPTGAAHSVWWFWDVRGEFRNWYVNLEETGVVWQDDEIAGVDTVDQDLDIVVSRDRSWEWKDVDEFTERLAFPDHYWVHDEAAVWAEGRRVIARVEAGAFPFDGTWVGWRPDPAWEQPSQMPSGWNRPRAQ